MGVAIGLMLLYIWFRFELQFGLGAVVALPLVKVAVAVVSPRRLPPLRLKSAACAIAGSVAAKTTAAKVFNLDMESP